MFKVEVECTDDCLRKSFQNLFHHSKKKNECPKSFEGFALEYKYLKVIYLKNILPELGNYFQLVLLQIVQKGPELYEEMGRRSKQSEQGEH